MDREDFMDIVYSELHSDGDNNRANRIIDAADEYATDKNVGTTISRQRAIDAVTDELDMIDHVPQWVFDRLEGRLKQLPPAQPETATVTIGRTKGSVTMWYECDACGEPVDQNDNYCRNCGRKLKHE